MQDFYILLRDQSHTISVLEFELQMVLFDQLNHFVSHLVEVVDVLAEFVDLQTTFVLFGMPRVGVIDLEPSIDLFEIETRVAHFFVHVSDDDLEFFLIREMVRREIDVRHAFGWNSRKEKQSKFGICAS